VAAIGLILAVTAVHAQPAPADITQSNAYKEAVRLIGPLLDPGQRYTDNCIDGSGTTQTDFPGYPGQAVKRCIYAEGNFKGLVYTLHPSKEQMATWMANACAFLPPNRQATCARRLWGADWQFVDGKWKTVVTDWTGIWGSNNAQYAVAGNVIEKGKDSYCTPGSAYFNIQFRDGVTVATQTAGKMCVPMPGGQSQPISLQEAESKAPLQAVFRVVRVPAIQPATYERVTCSKVPVAYNPAQSKTLPTEAWLKIARDNHIEAMRTGRNKLLDMVAKARFAALPACPS
jgi:hypothetical protein